MMMDVNPSTTWAAGSALVLASFAQAMSGVPINSNTHYEAYCHPELTTYSLDLENQESVTRHISVVGILGHYYSIATADKSVIEKIVDASMCTYLQKLYTLVVTEFCEHKIDLTYQTDSSDVKLLVNIHGSDNPELDVEKLDIISDRWFKQTPISVTMNLLIDVVD